MLINEHAKKSISGYLADYIINFVNLANKNKILDLVILCSKDKESKEYIQLRKMLVESFVKSFDNRELLLVYQESEMLLSGSPTSGEQDKNMG